MSAPRISVALAWVPDDRLSLLDEFRFAVQQHVGLMAGYKSLTIWKDCDLPERYSVVFHHEEVEGEPNVFETMAGSPEYEKALAGYAGPPDIHPMRVEYMHAAAPGNLQPGQLMSVSLRKAEPGYAGDLKMEMEGIFESLKYIDGYLGSAFGSNLALNEEIIGLVFWRTRRAFDESVPRGSFYEIRLYERIF